MNLAKIKKKISNLEKIKEVIEISKLDTINKLHKVKKITNTNLELSLVAKKLLEFNESKLEKNISNFNKKNKKRTLWIFATISSNILGDSYKNYFNMIKKEFDPQNDSIILIGKPAIELVSKTSWKIIYMEEDFKQSLKQTPNIISAINYAGDIKNIRFVSNSSFVKEKPLTIIPIKETDIIKESNIKIDKKFKFYPSILNVIENTMRIYVVNLVMALLKETQYSYLRQKLFRHEESIKTVDNKIDETKKQLNKLARKKETEEIILVTQIAQRGNDE